MSRKPFPIFSRIYIYSEPYSLSRYLHNTYYVTNQIFWSIYERSDTFLFTFLKVPLFDLEVIILRECFLVNTVNSKIFKQTVSLYDVWESICKISSTT